MWKKVLLTALILLIVGVVVGASGPTTPPSAPVDAPIAPPPPPPTSETTTLEGALFVNYGDPQALEEETRILVTLQTADGESILLQTNPHDMQMFHTEIVTVTGYYLDAMPQNVGASGFSAAFVPTGVQRGAASIENASANTRDVSGAQPWVNILCRFAGDATEPKTPALVQDMFRSTYPGMNDYWQELSYGAININGTTTANMWVSLPNPRSFYATDGDTSPNLTAIFNDCTAAANTQSLYYPNYVGINMFLNDDIGCCAWGGGQFATLDGVSKSYRVTWLPPWSQNHHTIAHEMGHGFGFPHSTGPSDNPPSNLSIYVSRWDVMSRGGYCDTSVTNFGCITNGTIAKNLADAGWITPGRIVTVPSGSSQTVTLDRTMSPVSGSSNLMVKVPIQNSATKFYTVEVRDLVDYDAASPYQAVVIHDVDTTRGGNGGPAYVVDAADGNDDVNDQGAAWQVGETYTDSTNSITIAVLSKSGSSFTVQINNGSTAIDWTARYYNSHGHWDNINYTADFVCQESVGSDIDEAYTAAPCNNTDNDIWTANYSATVNFSGDVYYFIRNFENGYVRLYIDGALQYSAFEDGLDSGDECFVPGLWLSGTKEVEVVFRKNSGATNSSIDFGWTTNQTDCPADAKLTAPANGELSGSSVTISASVIDRSGTGIDYVTFYYYDFISNQWNIIATDTTAPYSVQWNFGGLPAGTYYLSAGVYDNSQNWHFLYGSAEWRVVTLTDNLLANPNFNTNLSGWSFFGNLAYWWSGGGVNLVRNGWTEPSMYQIVNQAVSQGDVIEAKARFTNNSNVPKTVMLNVRNQSFSDQMICSVVLDPGESRYLTLQDVASEPWPSIYYTIRTFDRDSIASVRVDDALLRVRDDLAITDKVCSGDDPVQYINYLQNGDFSLTNWRYWQRWGSIVGDLAGQQLSLYRPVSAGAGGVFTRVYQYFPSNSHLQLTMEITNNSGSMKGLNTLLREEGWLQFNQCDFNIFANSTHRVNVRLTTNQVWGNAIVSLRPLQADGVPLVVDNVSLVKMPSSNPACANVVISPTPELTAISAPPYISGETADFNISSLPDDASIALDCDADGVFESDGLSCSVFSDTITGQVTYADGKTATTHLTLEVMSPAEALAYLQEIAPQSAPTLAAVATALDSNDAQAAFDALLAASESSSDPALAAWLNRLAYVVGQ